MEHVWTILLQLKYFLCAIGGGDQGYGSGRYDSRPGGYGYGYGRSRDYGGRWVAKGLGDTLVLLFSRVRLPGSYISHHG